MSRKTLSSSEFSRLYKNAKTIANRNLVMYYKPGENEKVGFAAGKKLGNAVVRNRLKRLMRESFRLNERLIPRGVSIILLARKNLLGKNRKAVDKALLELVSRLKF